MNTQPPQDTTAGDVVLNIRHACLRPKFKHAHHAMFHAGPSATVAIGGVRSPSVLLHPRGAMPASN